MAKWEDLLSVDEAPWLQMEGETTLWYRRFTTYLTLGPGRTIRKTYEVCYSRERGIAAGGVKAQRLVHWRNASSRNSWADRAEAYDTAQCAEDRRVFEEERRKDIRDRYTLAKVMRRQLVKALAIIEIPTPEDIRLGNAQPLGVDSLKPLTDILIALNKETRAEFEGEGPTVVVNDSSIRVTGNNDHAFVCTMLDSFMEDSSQENYDFLNKLALFKERTSKTIPRNEKDIVITNGRLIAEKTGNS